MSCLIRGLFQGAVLPTISAGLCSAPMYRCSSEKSRFKRSEIETAEMRDIKVKLEEKRAVFKTLKENVNRLQNEIVDLTEEYIDLKNNECKRLLEAGYIEDYQYP